MSSEISWRHQATGDTLYFTIRNGSRQYWNTDTDGPAFESLAVANWYNADASDSNYWIALTETPVSSYFYVGDWPATLTTVGFYYVDIYLRAGSNPAISDTLLGTLIGLWDGTEFKLGAVDSLGPEACRDVSQLVHFKNIWHVAKTGNDSNDGKSYDTAKLTIAGAVAVCGQGDEIVVWASGTDYDEAVDLSSLTGVTLRVMRGAKITTDENITLTVGDYGLVCGAGWIENTSTGGTATAIYGSNLNSIAVSDVKVSCLAVGIDFRDVVWCEVNGSRISASEYGIVLSDVASGRLFYNSIRLADWTICHVAGIRGGIIDGETSILAVANDIKATLPGGNINSVSGISAATGAKVASYDNSVRAISAGTGKAYGLWAIGSGSEISTKGDRLYAESSGGSAYDINAEESTEILVYGSAYETTQANGTITDLLNQAAADAAAILEDTDTTLPALIISYSPIGEGAYTGTLTVDDGDGTALEGVVVNAYRGGVLKASGETDSNGQITDWVFGAYTYSLAARIPGYQPATDTITVSANGWTKTISMTAISITSPDAPTLCTVQFRVKLSDVAVSGAVCKAQLLGINQASDGTILSNAESSDTTDSEGVAELQLVRKDSIVKGDGVYKMWITIAGAPVASVETTIPNQSTVLFEDLLRS